MQINTSFNNFKKRHHNKKHQILFRTLKCKDYFKVENLKLLPADYEVTISRQNASLFRDPKKDLEYLIALEPDSVFGS